MIPIQSMLCILPYKVQLQIECIISFNDFKDVINSKPYPQKKRLICLISLIGDYIPLNTTYLFFLYQRDIIHKLCLK